jgi:hypothetical protein
MSTTAPKQRVRASLVTTSTPAPVLEIDETRFRKPGGGKADVQEIDDNPFRKIKDIGGKVSDGTLGAVDKIKNELNDVRRELDDARGTLDKVKNFITDFPNLIKREFEKIIDKIKGIVNDALKDIKAAFAWVGKIKEFWNKFKGWIISVACTVAVLCFIALIGPLIIPAFTFLRTLRSAGNTVANSVVGAPSAAY